MGSKKVRKSGNIRLKTYGTYETYDFWFSDLVKAKNYGFKWIDEGHIWQFDIYNGSDLLFSYKLDGEHRCLDWDEVYDYYKKIDKRRK